MTLWHQGIFFSLRKEEGDERDGDDAAILGDNHSYSMAQAFAATMSYLLEKFLNLITLKGQESDFVLENSHIVHITYSNRTLGNIRTDATHILNSENSLFFKLLAAPYQDVTEQVTEFALRTVRVIS